MDYYKQASKAKQASNTVRSTATHTPAAKSANQFYPSTTN